MEVEGRTPVDDSTVETLQNDNFQLSQYVQKASYELERCTKLLRANNVSTSAALRGLRPQQEVPAWATDMDLMAPLISTYEGRVRELEHASASTAGLAEQATSLAKENDALRSQLAEREEARRQLVMASRGFNSSSGEGSRGVVAGMVRPRIEEERDEFEQLYKLSQEQNEVLQQQNSLFKVQVLILSKFTYSKGYITLVKKAL